MAERERRPYRRVHGLGRRRRGVCEHSLGVSDPRTRSRRRDIQLPPWRERSSTHGRRHHRNVRPRTIALALALALAALNAGCGSARPTRLPAALAPASLPRSPSSHVVLIVLENKEYGDVIGSPATPYLDRLVRHSGLATRSYAITHPSLPNYLALTSGSTHGITSDCTDCQVSGPSLATQLDRAGRSWKAYLEGAPRRCFRGAEAGSYAKKHNPFAYYEDIARDPARCRRLVPLSALTGDLRTGDLPAFAMISPDLCHDTHDCDVRVGDRFLGRLLPAILHELGPHGFLVLTWDEGTTDAGCCGVARGGHIATAVAGPDVRPGSRTSRPVDHYGVLRFVERAFGLPPLAGAEQADDGALRALFIRLPRLTR